MAEPKSFLLSEDLHRYLLDHGTPPDEVARALMDDTRALGDIAIMQVAPEQGALLTLLTRVTGARQAIEIGTFTGYSALCIARGLPDDGRLVCCDVSEEWTEVGRRAWARAGVADRVDLRIAPALDTIAELPDDARFDLAFIDADKPNYRNYVDALLPHLRPGGLVVVDNVLWMGAVLDPAATDPDTEAIRAFNRYVAAHEAFDTVMLPVADGLTLLRVR